MTTFVFAYRVPDKPLSQELAELDEDARAARLAAWGAWMETMGSSLLEAGNPVDDARRVGNCDAGTRIGGYSIVSAPDIGAAVELARGCPALGRGGGVEVGELLLDLPVPRESIKAVRVAG